MRGCNFHSFIEVFLRLLLKVGQFLSFLLQPIEILYQGRLITISKRSQICPVVSINPVLLTCLSHLPHGAASDGDLTTVGSLGVSLGRGTLSNGAELIIPHGEQTKRKPISFDDVAIAVPAPISTIWRAIQQAQPSKLDPYRKPLVRLTKAGASLDDLKAWLEAQDVQAERTAIWMTVRRWMRDQKEPHFLSPGWKPKGGSAG